MDKMAITKQRISGKQEGHDGPEVAHLYKNMLKKLTPLGQGQFKPQGFYLNKLGTHPL
jgi:hypothetical protein